MVLVVGTIELPSQKDANMGSRGDVRNSSSDNIGTYRNSRRVVTTISVRLGEFGRREEWFAIVSFLGEGCLSSGQIAGSVRTDAMETSRMVESF